jgi:hypothetical protein
MLVERTEGGERLRRWVEFAVIAVLLVCVAVNVPRAFSVADADGETAVANADHALRVAFVSVLDAEHNGAEVGLLLPRLNEAGSVLSQAEEALKAGNYSKALADAGTCKSLADGVAGDAVALKNDAVAASGNWWVTVLLSIVASVVFTGVLFSVWRWFRRGCVKKMLGSRPEVTG